MYQLSPREFFQYLCDLLWYIEQCKTIEPLLGLEHVEQNPPIQLIGNLSEQLSRICSNKFEININYHYQHYYCLKVASTRTPAAL